MIHPSPPCVDAGDPAGPADIAVADRSLLGVSGHVQALEPAAPSASNGLALFFY